MGLLEEVNFQMMPVSPGVWISQVVPGVGGVGSCWRWRPGKVRGRGLRPSCWVRGSAESSVLALAFHCQGDLGGGGSRPDSGR